MGDLFLLGIRQLQPLEPFHFHHRIPHGVIAAVDKALRAIAVDVLLSDPFFHEHQRAGRIKEAILPLLVGNLVAGVLISGLAQLCKTFWTIESLDYILYALFGIAVILFVITIIKLVKSKPKQEKTEE